LGRKSYFILALFSLLGLALLQAYLPIWQAGVPEELTKRLFPTFLIATALTLIFRAFSNSRTPEIILGAISCLWIFGSAGILLLAIPPIWALFLSFTRAIALRLLLLALLLAALQYSRPLYPDSLLIWWLLGFWLKLLALAFDWKAKIPSRAECSELFLYWYSPPFFFSPLPLEWISFRAFRAAEENESSTRSGIGYLFFGAALAGADLIVRRFEPFQTWIWDLSRLDSSNDAWFHLYAGWCFFFLRLLQYSSLTAIAVGCFHLLGRKVRYDFSAPLLSKNMWDFWLRYHNYSREFLWNYLFLPISLLCSRKFSWHISAVAGMAAVYLQISLVQFLAIIPIPGVSSAQSYSLEGSLKHTLWSFLLLGLSMLLDKAVLRLKPLLGFLTDSLRILLTQILLAVFFYNSYAQLWKNWSHLDFLRAIFSF
jgi:hypothetical protein